MQPGRICPIGQRGSWAAIDFARPTQPRCRSLYAILFQPRRSGMRCLHARYGKNGGAGRARASGDHVPDGPSRRRGPPVTAATHLPSLARRRPWPAEGPGARHGAKRSRSRRGGDTSGSRAHVRAGGSGGPGAVKSGAKTPRDVREWRDQYAARRPAP
jgi:hypothetical protein